MLSQSVSINRDVGTRRYQCNQHLSLDTSEFLKCAHDAIQWTTGVTASNQALSTNIVFEH